MIIGFEQITENLPPTLIKTYAELISIEIRANHLGVGREVKNKTLSQYLLKHGHNVKEVQIRETLHFIRKNYKFVNNDLQVGFICANSKGYFLTFNKQKIKEYKDSLRQRWQSIKEVYDTIE